MIFETSGNPLKKFSNFPTGNANVLRFLIHILHIADAIICKRTPIDIDEKKLIKITSVEVKVSKLISSLNKKLDNKTKNKVCSPLPTAEDSADNLSKCISSSLFLLEFLIDEGVAITLVPRELRVNEIIKKQTAGIIRNNTESNELNNHPSSYIPSGITIKNYTRMRRFLFFINFFEF